VTWRAKRGNKEIKEVAIAGHSYHSRDRGAKGGDGIISLRSLEAKLPRS